MRKLQKFLWEKMKFSLKDFTVREHACEQSCRSAAIISQINKKLNRKLQLLCKVFQISLIHLQNSRQPQEEYIKFQKQPPEMFYRKAVLKNCAKLTRKLLCRNLAQALFCKFCKIFKNTFLTERLWVTAFGTYMKKLCFRSFHLSQQQERSKNALQ